MTFIFSLFLTTACTSFSPRGAGPAVTESLSARCPAEATKLQCKDLIAPEIAFIGRELYKNPPTSEITLRVVNNLSKLQVPIHLQLIRDPTRRQNIAAVELTFTQFLDAYRTFPGGNELIAILQSTEFTNGKQVKEALTSWLAVYLPGYSFYWLPPGKPSFIEEAHFFNYLKERQIPIGNHHDLLAHLFLFLDPQIRNLTERLADLYEIAAKRKTRGFFGFQHINLAKHVNFLWGRLQENTPVQYKDRAGNNRIAIIGGYPSVLAPFEPLSEGTLFYWVYLREAHSFYEKLDHYLKTNMTLKNRGELLDRHNQLLHDLGEVMGIKERKNILQQMRYAPDDISSIFVKLNFETNSYQDIWLKFSESILTASSPTLIQIMKPENHRKFMEQSIGVLELLLKDNP